MSCSINGGADGDHVEVFRKYYEEADVFLSTEGILKLVSILGCIVSVVTGAVAAGAGGGCAAGALAGAGATLGAAAALALLLAAAAARLPLRVPQLCLYTDIILSAVAGAVIFVVAVLHMALCAHNTALDYVHGPLGVAVSCAVTASSVAVYRAATSGLDSPPPPAPCLNSPLSAPGPAPFLPQHIEV